MCKCTPALRTPFCGKPGCQWPPGSEPARAPDTSSRPDADEVRQVLTVVFLAAALVGKIARGDNLHVSNAEMDNAESIAARLVDRFP